MPRKNKNKNGTSYKDRNRNNQLHHVTNGGINSNKWSNNRIANSNKKSYITPSIIEALEKNEEFDVLPKNTQNQNHNPNKKKNKKNRQKALQNLAETNVIKNVKTKLSIGDDEIRPLMITRPHCRLNSTTEDVFNLIIGYVQNYFTCFDNTRDLLIGAYNPKSLLSMSLNLQNPVGHRFFKFDDSLVKESRNLKRIFKRDHQTNERKYRLIKQGHLEIVNFLSRLPQTEHEPSSFKLDNCFFTPNMISFNVSGVFREGKSDDNVRPLRCFNRAFVCIPDASSQMSIVNEQLILSNMTQDQYKLYFCKSRALQKLS